MSRYKIIEVEATTHLSGAVKILNDGRPIGEILLDEISNANGAKIFSIECPTFAWCLAGGYYRLVLHELDPQFNIDIAMRQLSSLLGRPPIDFFAQIEKRMSNPSGGNVPALNGPEFTPIAMGPNIPCEGMGGTLMRTADLAGETVSVYAAPSAPCLNGDDPVVTAKLMDIWFSQIRDILQELKRRHGSIKVAFMGGGIIQIPQWFKDWCVQEGIEIWIIDPPIASN